MLYYSIYFASYQLWVFYVLLDNFCYNEAMGLFNFMKKSEKSTSAAEATPSTPWDDLRNQPFQGDQALVPSETLQERVQRQGDKLIAMYMQNNPSVLNQKVVTVTPSETAQFYQAMNDGRLNDAAQSQLLQQIPSAFGAANQPNYQGVFEQVRDKHGMKILAFAAGLPPEIVNSTVAASTLTGDHIQLFNSLMQQCPTPIEFASREEDLMNRLSAAGNSNAKLAQYEDAFERFKQAVYGKRYEYYQALDVLKNKALQEHMRQIDEADRPRREAELRRLQTPIAPLDEDDSYASPEQRRFFHGNDQ